MKSIAIVGFGPRGLHVLENLFIELANVKYSSLLDITIFEQSDELGVGAAWSNKQEKVNWLNISERALQNLPERPSIQFDSIYIKKFPSYKEWAIQKFGKEDFNKADTFPPRKKMGMYLNERTTSLIEHLQKDSFRIFKKCVTNIDLKNSKLVLETLDKDSFEFDEIVLTIGHQPTQIDEDIKHYMSNSSSCKQRVITEPYPLSKILNLNTINGNSTVAIRGFGLAMIDVTRGLTICKGGKFNIVDEQTFKSEFVTSKETPKKIIPYSLDGFPLVPKPLNAILDAYFTPSNSQLNHFKNEVNKIATNKEKTIGNDFLLEILSKIASDIYQNHPNKRPINNISKKDLAQLAKRWLKDNSYQRELFIDLKQETATIIQQQILMSCGKIPISLDYCIGQVIRHCQPTLYKSFSHAKVDEKIIKEVIAFDERMKRYSYGPPVESMQQLLALHKAKILDFNFVDNPKIISKNRGWLFSKDEESIEIDVIINSVLSSPKIQEVSSPLVLNLLKNKNIKPIHSDLGFHTNKDGTLYVDDESLPKISVLGRLAKGSVIGVDAILECFGPRINDWAKGFVKRL